MIQNLIEQSMSLTDFHPHVLDMSNCIYNVELTLSR